MRPGSILEGAAPDGSDVGADYPALFERVRDVPSGNPPAPPNAPPTAAFGHACVDLTCQFTDTSSDADGQIVARSWTFASAGSSTLASPAFAFAAPGTYTVTLTVTDDDGATATTSAPVSVTALLHAALLSSTTKRWSSPSGATNYWSAAVTVAAHGADERPIAGATITVAWTGAVDKDGVLCHRVDRAVHAAIRHAELPAILGDVDGHERVGPSEHLLRHRQSHAERPGVGSHDDQALTWVALIAGVALFQANAPASNAAGLIEDARTLSSAQTNEARFDALTALLRARNFTFAVESFTIAKPVGTEPRTEGRNVVVTIGDGAEEILVGAHYDAARLPDGTLSQGAVDNAASSVILVRVAEALLVQKSPPMRVEVVWFDMEELWLLGSDKYRERHGSDPIAAMLNFDVNGYGDTVLFGPDQARGQGLRGGPGSDLSRTTAELCVAPAMPPGDDRSFSKADIPTVSIAVVLPAVEAHQVWLLMNAKESGLTQGFLPAILRTIHSAEDTPAKLDLETMTQAIHFATSLVHGVAARPKGP